MEICDKGSIRLQNLNPEFQIDSGLYNKNGSNAIGLILEVEACRTKDFILDIKSTLVCMPRIYQPPRLAAQNERYLVPLYNLDSSRILREPRRRNIISSLRQFYRIHLLYIHPATTGQAVNDSDAKKIELN